MSVVSKLVAATNLAKKVNQPNTEKQTETTKAPVNQPTAQPKKEKKLGRRKKARQRLKQERERLLNSKQLINTIGGD